MLPHVLWVNIKCLSCNCRTAPIVSLKNVPHIRVHSSVMYVNTQALLQFKLASTVHDDLNKEVLLIRDRARWQNTNVKIFALSNVFSPAFIVKQLVQRYLVLDKTLPRVKPLVWNKVPDLVWLLSLFVSEDHQLALNLAALHKPVKFWYSCVLRVMSQMLVKWKWLKN